MGNLEVGLQADGALVVSGVVGNDGRLVRLAFEPRGSVSLTIVRGDEWSVASVEAGPATGDCGRLVRVRSARSAADGGVEGCCTLLCTTGERFDRELLVASDGSRRWTGRQRLHNGSSWTEEGVFDGTVAAIRRRALDGYGEGLWTEERETTFTGHEGARFATAATVAERTYDAGARRTIRRVAFGGDGPLRGEARITSVASDGEPGTTSESTTVIDADGRTTTRTVAPQRDGGTLVETRSRWSSGPSSESTEQTLTKLGPDGSSSVIRREIGEWRVAADESEVQVTVSEEEFIDEFGGVHTVSTSRAAGPDGSTSTTVSHIFPDGSMTIDTSTLDASQSGTITTTTIDASGGSSTSTITVSSTITIVPSGSGSGPPTGGSGTGSGGGEGSGPGSGPGTGGEGTGPTGPDRDECPDDGEWTECPPKMKEQKGQDSPTRMLPDEVGGVVDALGASRLEAATGSLAARIGAAVRRDAHGIGGQRGAGGRAALAADELGTLPGGDELHDPARIVDVALRSVAAVARSGAYPAEAVHRALVACTRLAREVAREEARVRR